MKLKLLIPIPLTQDSVTKISVETPGAVINLTADPSEVTICEVDVVVDDFHEIAVVAHSGYGYKKPLEFDYEVIEHDDSTDDSTDDDSNNGPRDHFDEDPNGDQTPEPNPYFPEDDS